MRRVSAQACRQEDITNITYGGGRHHLCEPASIGCQRCSLTISERHASIIAKSSQPGCNCSQPSSCSFLHVSSQPQPTIRVNSSRYMQGIRVCQVARGRICLIDDSRLPSCCAAKCLIGRSEPHCWLHKPQSHERQDTINHTNITGIDSSNGLSKYEEWMVLRSSSVGYCSGKHPSRTGYLQNLRYRSA